MQPSASLFGDFRDLDEGIECTNVDLTCLHDNQLGPIACFAALCQILGQHPALHVRIHTDQPLRPEPKIPKGRKNRSVHIISNKHMDLRCTEQSQGFAVPSDAAQQSEAGSRERGKVGHGAATRKSNGCITGQIEDVEEPT
ncbi:hypothetical protein SUH3_05790 [Pseudosulfitobacter pseudonitzschiae]|uniref:Uncharacterized protein n=1 Tax=Pseudosulfitobacter pseudonitzschiae TaxID=1402135 RepID=A0A073IXV4_9RHOB|nr:hypothetical protein SUH3_05790 [Pseudosulfitobacter pseudonitzschiae]